MNCLLVLSLAVLGASAAPCGVSFNTGCGSSLQGRTLYAQTPVIENPTSVFPPCVPSTSVTQSCHCLKTSVTPQIREEIITVPQVDRVIRVVPGPVVEAVSVDLGANTRNAQNQGFGVNSGIVSFPRVIEGVSGLVSGSYPRIAEGIVGGSSSSSSSSSSLQGFGGVFTSGNSGCGCGSNLFA